MVKTIKEHLEDIFEDLGEEKLRKFKIKLRDRKPENDKLVVRQATILKKISWQRSSERTRETVSKLI